MNTFAVLDLETTGLNQFGNDRVVEIAVVLYCPGRGIVTEFATLVNPERDVGPTRIHGLSATDVLNAPKFMEVAAILVDALQPSPAIVGHNVRFDLAFLRSEFERLGVTFPRCTVIDTMKLAGGGTLSACCDHHNIKCAGRAHSALQDARLTAQLLDTMLTENPELLAPYEPFSQIQWPVLATPRAKAFPRDLLASMDIPVPGYIQSLAAGLSHETATSTRDDAEEDYRSLLWKVLEDGRIEELEGDSLTLIATSTGLTFPQVEAIHLDYLTRLVAAAYADKRITEAEHREIQMVAQLLGFGRLAESELASLIPNTEFPASHPTKSAHSDLRGKTVCFTGECQCTISRQPITREQAETLAVQNGLTIANSVTKKLGLLVVADPNSQSGKAKKARQYGLRIIHEPQFWRTLGVTID